MYTHIYLFSISHYAAINESSNETINQTGRAMPSTALLLVAPVLIQGMLSVTITHLTGQAPVAAADHPPVDVHRRLA
jgi:hypothetical protein